jgi:hypothetical protein
MFENSTSKNFPNGLLIYNITKVKHEGASHPRKGTIQAHMPSQNFVAHPNLTIRMILHNKHSWRV